MKKINFEKLEITNFKGLKDFSITFDHNIIKIGGANGTGKTTIADAIYWCLFNKNYRGETVFGIKTRDKDGNVIPNIDHKVELTINVNGIVHVIGKVYKEIYKSYRGEEEKLSGHTTEYYIDGEFTTKTDYEKYINSLVDETTFKAITNPNYFLGLKWQEQRALLTQIAGEIDYSEINSSGKFSDILSLIPDQFSDVEAYIKHIGYNIKRVKDRSELIPELIKEQRVTMPAEEDWEALGKEKLEITSEISRLQTALNDARSGAADIIARDSLRQKIEFAKRRMDNIYEGAVNTVRRKEEQYTTALRTNTELLAKKKALITQKTADISAAQTLAAQVTVTIEDYQLKKKEIDAAYREWVAKIFIPEPNVTICPTCKRQLDPIEADEAIANAERLFNADKAKNIEAIKQSALKLKEEESHAADILKDYGQQVEKLQKEILELEKEIKELTDEKSEIAKPLSIQEELATNNIYQSLQNELNELNKQLEDDTAATDNSEVVDGIKSRISECNDNLNKINIRLSSQNVINSHVQRIDELDNELNTLLDQLAELYRKQELAIELQQLKGQILEDKVNNLFSLVKFTLFKEYLNENKEPYCEAWINNVPYSDANSAAKINGGLDIISALCNYYQVYAPIVIDNAESNLDILSTDSQQIRLYVTHDTSITTLP